MSLSSPPLAAPPRVPAVTNVPPHLPPRAAQTLFSRTVGPVKDVFVVYNSQGKSKGMALVAFQRPGDAAVARQKYNGKIVDGSESLLSPPLRTPWRPRPRGGRREPGRRPVSVGPVRAQAVGCGA